MFKSIARSLVFVASFSWAGIAAADGFYIAGNFGLNAVAETDLDYGFGFEPTLSFDVGYAFGAEAGFIFRDRIRFLGEMTYRQNDVDSLEFIGFEIPMDGDVTSLAVIASVFYDFLPGRNVRPYVGGGLGLVNISFNDIRISGDPQALIDDDATAFAVQFGAGVAFNVAPNIDVTVDYRLLTAFAVEFTDTFGDKFESDYIAHTVGAGIRFRF